MPSFIIVGYVWQILGRGQKAPPPHPPAAPKKPILNRVKGQLLFKINAINNRKLSNLGKHLHAPTFRYYQLWNYCYIKKWWDDVRFELTRFRPMFLFYAPSFFILSVFRGYKKGTLAWNGLMQYYVWGSKNGEKILKHKRVLLSFSVQKCC